MSVHNADGTFKKGHSGNPAGRPRGDKARLDAFKAAIAAGDLEEITAALVERAKTSDTSAKLLFGYLYGLPRQAIDIDANVSMGVAYDKALAKVYGERE